MHEEAPLYFYKVVLFYVCQALTKENLNRAYKKVANKGASGIDEVTVEEWETISEKIRKQS